MDHLPVSGDLAVDDVVHGGSSRREDAVSHRGGGRPGRPRTVQRPGQHHRAVARKQIMDGEAQSGQEGSIVLDTLDVLRNGQPPAFPRLSGVMVYDVSVGDVALGRTD